MLDETVHRGPSRRGVIGPAVAASRCAVARVDGIVRGYVLTQPDFFGHGFVQLLVVHPDYRRRGLATTLMRAAELDAPTDKLFTSTNHSNVAAQRLLERLGFVRSGMIDNLDEGDPEIVYFKRLAPSARPDDKE
ncbi:MAG TPA: GNAT family N-acetyltransferase [Candidatus Binataceae bacterium]|nr:GNAT family N-acetyltransferase [Candidatus Binataceae bacterium]